MGFLDNFLKPTNKKITVDSLLKLLTTSNNSFNKICSLVEKQIFFGEIIDEDCPLEFQQDNVLEKENFKNRFIVSTGITGIAIIEFVIVKKYGADLYSQEIKEFKKTVFPNLLILREKILQRPTPSEFEDDIEPSLLNKSFAENQFIISVTQKANDISNLLNKTGEYRNIYYHLYLVLGQIIPDRDRIFFHPDFADLIDSKITEIIRLLDLYFDNL